jgi:outer membrane protein assembly factor BamA
MKTIRLMLGLGLALAANAAHAAQPPTIASIRFSGNAVTQPSVMLRELALAPGDPASPEAIEAGVQAIRDLGLFREVTHEEVPSPHGVELHIHVREKRYLLPIPRLDTSSDRDYSFGGQLRWSNVAGLNHRLDLILERGRFRDDPNREEEDRLRLSYRAPFVFDTRYNLFGSMERIEQATPGPQGSFDETFHRAEGLVSYDFTYGRPRHGWIVGAGLLWQDQTTSGDFAPPPDGEATALVLTGDYSNVRFDLYSETGRRVRSRLESAAEGVGSDYHYTRWTGEFAELMPLGETPHQTLHLLAAGGVLSGGPRSRNAFDLGGSSRLRGYDSEFLEGERFHYVAVEYLRPIRYDWLRLLVVGEVGGTDRALPGKRDGNLYGSLGVGVRIRLTWFVDIEIEAGVAVPLRGGGGARFFAGTN